MIWYSLSEDDSSISKKKKKEITYLDTKLQYFSDYHTSEYCDENIDIVLIEYVYNTEKCAVILSCDNNLGYFSRYAPEFKTLTSNNSAYTYCLKTYKWVNENRDLFNLRRKKNRKLLRFDGGIKLSIKEKNDEYAFYSINAGNYSNERNKDVTMSLENIISKLSNQNIKFEDIISSVNEKNN
ncbi:hypothetical protein N9300_00650 [bacterium]|nr:hypothetical protein [bacterium]